MDGWIVSSDFSTMDRTTLLFQQDDRIGCCLFVCFSPYFTLNIYNSLKSIIQSNVHAAECVSRSLNETRGRRISRNRCTSRQRGSERCSVRQTRWLAGLPHADKKTAWLVSTQLLSPTVSHGRIQTVLLQIFLGRVEMHPPSVQHEKIYPTEMRFKKKKRQNILGKGAHRVKPKPPQRVAGGGG